MGSGSEARERLAEILEAIVGREYVSPGDVVVETGLPRYLVLAAFQCLEALGLVEQVYSRGSYKVYTATLYARRLLEALRSGSEAPLLAALTAAPGVHKSGEAAEAEAGAHAP